MSEGRRGGAGQKLIRDVESITAKDRGQRRGEAMVFFFSVFCPLCAPGKKREKKTPTFQTPNNKITILNI